MDRITTEAADEVGRIHDRMPMTIARADWAAWLSPDSPAETASSLLVPAAHTRLDAYPVSTAVNSVRNNGPELIAPLPAEAFAKEPQLKAAADEYLSAAFRLERFGDDDA